MYLEPKHMDSDWSSNVIYHIENYMTHQVRRLIAVHYDSQNALDYIQDKM